MAISNEVVLNVETGQAVQSIKELRQNIKKYRDDVVAAGSDSDKYREALSKLAESQSQLNKINRDVRASTLNLTDVWSQATNVVGGLIAGFNAFTSVTTLLGIENDKLAETFVKLQAGMNLVQSLTSVSKGFKSLLTLLPKLRTAFAALNATIAANPLAAAAIAIGAVVAVLNSLSSRSRENTQATKELDDSFKSFNDTISRNNDLLDENIYQLELQGASELDVIQARIDAVNENIEVSEEYARSLQNEIFAAENSSAAFIALGNGNLRESQRILDKLREQFSEAYSEYEGFLTQRSQLTTNYTNTERRKAINAANQRRADAKRAAEQAYKEEQQRQEALEKLDREFWARIEANQKAAGQRIIDSIRAIDEEARREFEDADDVNIPFIERLDSFASLEAIEARRAAYQEEISNLWMLANDETESVAVRAKAFQDYYKQKERYQEFDKKATAVAIDLNNKEVKAQEMKFKAVSSFLGLASNLLAENTVAAQGVAVASALFSAYAGSAQVLKDAELPFYAKLAAYATILSAGLGAAKSAKSVKIPGASSSADIPVSTTPTMPDLSTVYTPTITPYVQELRSEEEREYNTRVYITQDDIADSMRQVEVRQNNTAYQ